jgi:hypothetical protein
MAILAHAVGLSMGNTCQLPLLTPKANRRVVIGE